MTTHIPLFFLEFHAPPFGNVTLFSSKANSHPRVERDQSVSRLGSGKTQVRWVSTMVAAAKPEQKFSLSRSVEMNGT